MVTFIDLSFLLILELRLWLISLSWDQVQTIRSNDLHRLRLFFFFFSFFDGFIFSDDISLLNFSSNQLSRKFSQRSTEVLRRARCPSTLLEDKILRCLDEFEICKKYGPMGNWDRIGYIMLFSEMLRFIQVPLNIKVATEKKCRCRAIIFPIKLSFIRISNATFDCQRVYASIEDIMEN